MKHNLHAIREGTMKVVFLLTACISILAVALICIFLFANGIPTMHKIGLGKFLFGMTWAPNQDLYGIFPMIIASILVTGGAILIGVPLGLLCALYLARFCPKRLYSVLKPAVDLLAGIPSIVYGFFGLVVLVPALKAVPDSFREGSFGLGAGKLRTVFRIVLPSAVPGIFSGIILAIGRIVGETAALIFTAGTFSGVAGGVMESGRTLAVHMYCLLNEGLHRSEAYATAVVLLVMVIGINALSGAAAKRIARRTQ